MIMSGLLRRGGERMGWGCRWVEGFCGVVRLVGRLELWLWGMEVGRKRLFWRWWWVGGVGEEVVDDVLEVEEDGVGVEEEGEGE